MVNQYQRVYSATDLYLVGGEEMGHCFNESFDAHPSQMLRSGLPRLVEYLNIDIKEEQQRLKEQYGIQGKLAVYMPTYRKIIKLTDKLIKLYLKRHCLNTHCLVIFIRLSKKIKKSTT